LNQNQFGKLLASSTPNYEANKGLDTNAKILRAVVGVCGEIQTERDSQVLISIVDRKMGSRKGVKPTLPCLKFI